MCCQNVAENVQRGYLQSFVAFAEAENEEGQILFREGLQFHVSKAEILVDQKKHTLSSRQQRPRQSRPRSRIGASWLRTAGTTRLFSMVTR